MLKHMEAMFGPQKEMVARQKGLSLELAIRSCNGVETAEVIIKDGSEW